MSVSGTSSPLAAPSSGQTLEYESRSGLASSKLSIVCHYNPIMDEYITSANTLELETNVHPKVRNHGECPY